jgi:hypothetical protein
MAALPQCLTTPQPAPLDWLSSPSPSLLRPHLVHVPLTAGVGPDPQPLELAAQLQRHLGSTQHAVLVHTVAARPARVKGGACIAHTLVMVFRSWGWGLGVRQTHRMQSPTRAYRLPHTCTPNSLRKLHPPAVRLAVLQPRPVHVEECDQVTLSSSKLGLGSIQRLPATNNTGRSPHSRHRQHACRNGQQAQGQGQSAANFALAASSAFLPPTTPGAAHTAGTDSMPAETDSRPRDRDSQQQTSPWQHQGPSCHQQHQAPPTQQAPTACLHTTDSMP